jgi:hypothetical protein
MARYATRQKLKAGIRNTPARNRSAPDNGNPSPHASHTSHSSHSAHRIQNPLRLCNQKKPSFLAAFSERCSPMTNYKFSMTISQFRFGALVLACLCAFRACASPVPHPCLSAFISGSFPLVAALPLCAFRPCAIPLPHPRPISAFSFQVSSFSFHLSAFSLCLVPISTNSVMIQRHPQPPLSAQLSQKSCIYMTNRRNQLHTNNLQQNTPPAN